MERDGAAKRGRDDSPGGHTKRKKVADDDQEENSDKSAEEARREELVEKVTNQRNELSTIQALIERRRIQDEVKTQELEELRAENMRLKEENDRLTLQVQNLQDRYGVQPLMPVTTPSFPDSSPAAGELGSDGEGNDDDRPVEATADEEDDLE